MVTVRGTLCTIPSRNSNQSLVTNCDVFGTGIPVTVREETPEWVGVLCSSKHSGLPDLEFKNSSSWIVASKKIDSLRQKTV